MLTPAMLNTTASTNRPIPRFMMQTSASRRRISADGCPGVTPGGGKIGCLKEHENKISVGCAKALKAIKTKMGK